MMHSYSDDFLGWLVNRMEKDSEEDPQTLDSPLLESFREALQFHKSGELIQAARYYQKVLEFDDINSKHFISLSLNNLAWIFLNCKTLRDLDEALKLALEADKMRDYMDTETIDTLAECYFQKGEFGKAVETIQRAIRYCDDFALKQDYLIPREKAFQKYLNKKPSSAS